MPIFDALEAFTSPDFWEPVSSFVRGTSSQAQGHFRSLTHGKFTVEGLIDDINKRPRRFSTTDFFPDAAHTLVGHDTLQGRISLSQVDYTEVAKGRLDAEDLESAINKALHIHNITDPEEARQWKQVLTLIAENESQSTPDSINDWDTNYHGHLQADGHPVNASRGVFQMIPETFARNHEPGTSNGIYDPVAGAAAVINYLQERYGVSPDGTGLQRFYNARYPLYKGY